MSSADFLFTPTVQRVLAATLANPDRSFLLSELLDLAAGGRGGAQQQIERLLQAGVLTEEPRRGRQRSIRANKDFFLFDELSSIARKSFGVKEPLMRALEPFGDSIREAFVFGSVAKGSDNGRSDIDLAVIGRVALREVTNALLDLEQELGRPIHLSLYDPEEWEELISSDQVMAQIAKGPKLELIRNDETV
ncbi:nucleotidyltransferase domain-containing protein [Variovorax paradoxus]|jgi:predicted nucleotidyltransferase|uniref:Nucleotidyltransferase n=2 Tax=Variovorax paradoxus TaxID=34073 RepID=A0AAW8EH30_VARPD|nr:nucleotidyltransferase domain-containing protein [Variovorax paradoxus]MBW8714734.1 nucleotidyltransferase domain-containing protein [Variovorax paradoxus]MDP9972103.1 putative nucleotidyltransferase [Variovorax paradoxus]